MGRSTGYYKEIYKVPKEKSRSIKGNETEIIYEVRTNQEEELIRVLRENVQIKQISFLSHDYVENINASVKMDSILMSCLTKPNETVSYQSYDNYVRYLKVFLANRLNYLGDLWKIDKVNFEVLKSTGESHKVDSSLEDGTI